MDALRVEALPRPGLMSAGWPRVMLMPGQVYRQTTVYRLSLQV
jgi:aldose 1-epimerase